MRVLSATTILIKSAPFDSCNGIGFSWIIRSGSESPCWMNQKGALHTKILDLGRGDLGGRRKPVVPVTQFRLPPKSAIGKALVCNLCKKMRSCCRVQSYIETQARSGSGFHCWGGQNFRKNVGRLYINAIVIH